MTRSKTLIILNPAAKGEKASSYQNKIEKIALREKADLKITHSPGHAGGIAKKAVTRGYETVVAAGGDGTINEIINGLAGSEVALGLLPVGTMNVFATELGLPSDVQKCWNIISAGHTRTVDLAKANDHYFIQLAGIGLDAQVVEETSREFKKNFGPLSYVISASQIAARKPPKLTIETKDKTHEGSFVLVGNGRHYGGPFVLFNQAKIDDGKLDVLIFQNLGYLDIVRYLQGIFFGGTHVDMHDVVYFQTENLTVSSEERVPVEVDGELFGETPVTFAMSEYRLKVFAKPL